jgi:hypothetical protein
MFVQSLSDVWHGAAKRKRNVGARRWVVMVVMGMG